MLPDVLGLAMPLAALSQVNDRSSIQWSLLSLEILLTTHALGESESVFPKSTFILLQSNDWQRFNWIGHGPGPLSLVEDRFGPLEWWCETCFYYMTFYINNPAWLFVLSRCIRLLEFWLKSFSVAKSAKLCKSATEKLDPKKHLSLSVAVSDWSTRTDFRDWK